MYKVVLRSVVGILVSCHTYTYSHSTWDETGMERQGEGRSIACAGSGVKVGPYIICLLQGLK